ncbi:putative MFS transporter [Bacillus sp. TS-2]|nr:putative MFS transporter [Bacillus sp. TS-2]
MEDSKWITFHAAILGLIPFIMVLGNSLFIPLVPELQKSFELSASEASIFLVSFSLPAALVIPMNRWFLSRASLKAFIYSSLIVIIGGIVLSLLSLILSSYLALLTGRFIQGIGAGLITPLAMMIAANWYEGRKRGEVLGIIEAFNGLAKVVSPLIGSFLLLLASWYYSLMVFLFFVLITFAAMSYLFSANKQKDHQLIKDEKEFSVLDFWLENRFLVLPIFVIGGSGMFLLFGWLYFLSFQMEAMHFSHLMIKGILFALPLAIFTLSTFFMGRYMFQMPENILSAMKLTVSCMVLAFIIQILWNTFFGLLLSLSVFSLSFGMFLPLASQWMASQLASKDRAYAFTWYSMIRFLGVAFGPLLFGQWLENVLQMQFYSLAIIGVSLLFLLTYLEPDKSWMQEA